jgi:hypothetical protein
VKEESRDRDSAESEGGSGIEFGQRNAAELRSTQLRPKHRTPNADTRNTVAFRSMPGKLRIYTQHWRQEGILSRREFEDNYYKGGVASGKRGDMTSKRRIDWNKERWDRAYRPKFPNNG